MKMPTIGILYICTGKYSIFWKDFFLSMEKNFIPGMEKHYFVFTDSPSLDFEDKNNNIHKIHQNDLGWPNNTLMRFHIFLKIENKLTKMDYLFFFNANLLVLEKISANEILPVLKQKLVATISPGFYNKNRRKFTYENRKQSTAYISNDLGEYYFAGGLNGGLTENFIQAMKVMRENINVDKNNNITAVWHDESHWNKYLVDRNDLKILLPSFLYPEGWDIPFKPIILVRDKNKHGGHLVLRNEHIAVFKKYYNKVKGVIYKLYKRVTKNM